MRRAYVNSYRNDWDELFPAIVCTYCATPHDSTGISPYRMLYGREMDMPIDIQYDTGAREEMPLCETAYNEWLIDSMREDMRCLAYKWGNAATKNALGTSNFAEVIGYGDHTPNSNQGSSKTRMWAPGWYLAPQGKSPIRSSKARRTRCRLSTLISWLGTIPTLG